MENYEDYRFGSEHDKLQRKKYAQRLTEFLIANKEDVDVACINAPWGTGKTWFVHMWKNYIKEEYSQKDDGSGIVPVYYNSWENDDYQNALIPLIAEIKTQLFPDNTGNTITKFAKASGAILKDAAYNALNLATAGLFDFRVGSEAANELNDEVLYEKSIAQYSTNIEEKKNFKESLEAIIKDEIKKHVFVFVDELDRCRPTFAIETLERIKHYFDVEGITFILMLDKVQLSGSVKVLYGNDCDTAGYLLRFIDIEYNLPRINHDIHIDAVFDRQVKFADFAQIIAQAFDLTIRDYQKILIWVKAFGKTINTDFQPFGQEEYFLMCYFLIVKLKYPEEFSSFCNLRSISYDTLPRVAEVEQVLVERINIELIKSFVFACDVVRGKKSEKDFDGENLMENNRIFIQKMVRSGKCQRIFDALSFLEYIQ